MNNKKALEQYYKEVKEVKVGFFVLLLGIAFYFINSPGGEEVYKVGRIIGCGDYNFLKEYSKEITVKLDNNNIKKMRYYKCHVGQDISIINQKRLITKQNVYTIKYI